MGKSMLLSANQNMCEIQNLLLKWSEISHYIVHKYEYKINMYILVMSNVEICTCFSVHFGGVYVRNIE